MVNRNDDNPEMQGIGLVESLYILQPIDQTPPEFVSWSYNYFIVISFYNLIKLYGLLRNNKSLKNSFP